MAHKIEVAPSGRASCRGCKQAIPKGTPRFGEEFANQFSEDGGMSFRYWHLACAATKLANELAAALAAYDGPIVDRPALDALIAEHLRPPTPYLEHASNGRARCRGCDTSIAKGELRMAFERTFDGPMGAQKGTAYSHARCLAQHLEREKEHGRAGDAAELFRQLDANSKATASAEDMGVVRQALGL